MILWMTKQIKLLCQQDMKCFAVDADLKRNAMMTEFIHGNLNYEKLYEFLSAISNVRRQCNVDLTSAGSVCKGTATD